MHQFLRRIWYVVRHRQLDAELAEEMALHRAMKQQELEEAGLEPQEAAFATRRALGSTALAQDHAHDVWVPRWLQGSGRMCAWRFAPSERRPSCQVSPSCRWYSASGPTPPCSLSSTPCCYGRCRSMNLSCSSCCRGGHRRTNGGPMQSG